MKALKRRKMYARKGGRKGEGGGEVESVFKGYVSRDRRKPHIVEADDAAERLLRRARVSGEPSCVLFGRGCASRGYFITLWAVLPSAAVWLNGLAKWHGTVMLEKSSHFSTLQGFLESLKHRL